MHVLSQFGSPREKGKMVCHFFSLFDYITILFYILALEEHCFDGLTETESIWVMRIGLEHSAISAL